MDPSNNEEFHLPRLQFSDSLWRSHPIASIRDGESFRSPSYPHPDRRQQAFSDDLQLVHARLDTLDTELASIRARVTIIEARLEAIDPEIECVACREMKRSSNMVKVSCLHSYCKSCLSALFQAATDQESSFPPKCCHLQITLSEAEDGLSEELRKRYKLKAEEFTTEDRTYCANRTCSAFLPSHQIINGTAYCRMCPAITCAKCKGYVDGTSHIRGECTRETLDKDLRELKEKKRLQQCYRCHRLIELIEGCNHVVCICKAQFCHVCGLKWKTCECQDMLGFGDDEYFQFGEVPRNPPARWAATEGLERFARMGPYEQLQATASGFNIGEYFRR